MNLTDEQHAICQAARDLDAGSSLKIQAFAGSGKTTTLAAIAESLAQRKFLYLCSIVRPRMKQNIKCHPM
jgi:F-box protein 18 (helicase)